jgi:hypothetical protein
MKLICFSIYGQNTFPILVFNKGQTNKFPTFSPFHLSPPFFSLLVEIFVLSFKRDETGIATSSVWLVLKGDIF